MDLALNNQQLLICHKTKTNQTKPQPLNSHLTNYQIKTSEICGALLEK